MAARTLLIGIGNSLRGDDAAGLEVARRARALAAAGGDAPVECVEHEGEPLALLDAWEGADAVVLVDALHGGGPVGSAHRFEATARPLPALLVGSASASTHAIDLAQAIELGRELGRLPACLVLFGLSGACFHTGAGLSPAVAQAIGPLAERALNEAGELAKRPV